MAGATTGREVVVSRVIDAPRELVFAAFTEREHVENWWVPPGTTIHEYEAAPGGLWRYSQPGPRGSQYSFRIEFVEVTKPTRLVYDFGPDTEDAPDPVHTTVTFEEQDGKTTVTLHLLFATADAREEAARYGAVQGATRALDNVANYLGKL